ncbi:MAG: hypothetical protein OXU32_16385 [Gammaproteobacteria bacterium]|nr:hypothetical protein [Gammaproteobacteria bacterium]
MAVAAAALVAAAVAVLVLVPESGPRPFEPGEWRVGASTDVVGRATLTAATAAERVDGYGTPPLLGIRCRDGETVLVQMETRDTPEDVWSGGAYGLETAQVRFDDGPVEDAAFSIRTDDEDDSQLASVYGDEAIWLVREMTRSDRVGVLLGGRGAVFSLRGGQQYARRILEVCGVTVEGG